MEYQSKNDYLNKFKEINLSVNWLTILIGLEGPGKFEAKLTAKDVTNYAISKVEKNNYIHEEVITIAGVYNGDTDLLIKCVKKLVGKEVHNKEVELKKWIIVLLIDILKDINQDPLYGLIQLTEFWEKFDYPKFSPHIIQGVNNKISPKNYYTEKNFHNILNLHHDWIKKETELKLGMSLANIPSGWKLT